MTTKKTTKKPTTLLRKNHRIRKTDEKERTEIVTDFVKGVSIEDLADKYRLATKTVYEIVTNHWESLTNIRESRLLTLPVALKGKGAHRSNTYHALKAIQGVGSINKKFMDLLSGENDPTLSDNEIQFALIYVASGNSRKAMISSGLDVGLIQGKAVKAAPNTSRGGFNLGLQLRTEYLKAKPNVAAYLNELKTERYLPAAIDLQSIQRELLEQLDQVKNDDGLSSYNQKTMRLKITEKLGQTIAAFSDRVTVETVDPAKALDYLSGLASANKDLSTELIELTPEST